MANELQRVQSVSTPSLPERAAHREWIGGRAVTLLSHYWRDDDPIELTAAIGQDWADVLEGLPQEFIQRACVAYLRDEPSRKPKPGAIYKLAKAMMPPPYRHAAPPPPLRDPIPDETRRAILKDAGFRLDENGSVAVNVKRFGGTDQ